MGELILLRHGETEWSRTGRHTGRTDVPLTPAGEAAAAALAPRIAAATSAAPAPAPCSGRPGPPHWPALADVKQDPGLREWDYGGYEGMTTPQIREQRPGWYLWRDGVIPGGPGYPGETAEQVGARADEVLARVTPLLADGDVVLVSHGHFLRVLTARWLRLGPSEGRLFRLGTGTVCTLGTEHGEPVITSWNVPPATARLIPRQDAGERSRRLISAASARLPTPSFHSRFVTWTRPVFSATPVSWPGGRRGSPTRPPASASRFRDSRARSTSVPPPILVRALVRPPRLTERRSALASTREARRREWAAALGPGS